MHFRSNLYIFTQKATKSEKPEKYYRGDSDIEFTIFIFPYDGNYISYKNVSTLRLVTYLLKQSEQLESILWEFHV